MKATRVLAAAMLVVALASLLACVMVEAAAPTAVASASGTVLAATSNSTVNCTALTDCASCAAYSECGFCAFSGRRQGSGSCMNASESEQCTYYIGSWVAETTQCAAPGDSCANYQNLTSANGCSQCDLAPASLNCGWCADGVDGDRTRMCVDGNVFHPLNGTCAEYAWRASVLSSSCLSSQAQCNEYDGQGCEACAGSDNSCGYCESSGRCEYTTGTTAAAGDCAATNFTTNEYQCPSYVDPCLNVTSCESCVQTDPQCGWCASTATCEVGTATGPLRATCPATSIWTPQSSACPGTAAECATHDSCSSCAAASGCGWCGFGAGSCVQGTDDLGPASGTCSAFATFTTSSSSCDADLATVRRDFPGIGYLSAILLALPTILVVAVACTASLRSRLFPSHGAPRDRDFTATSVRVIVAMIAMVALLLKLAALFIDRWDAAQLPLYHDGTVRSFSGLLGMRWRSAEDFDAGSQSYASLCSSLKTAGTKDQYGVCHLLQASGLLTLIVLCLSTLLAILTSLFALLGLCSPLRYLRGARRVANLAVCSCVLAAVSLVFWFGGFHILHRTERSDATLASSWVLLLLGTGVDLLLVFLARVVVRRTEDPRALDEGLFEPLSNNDLGAGSILDQSHLPTYYPPQQRAQLQQL